MRDGPIQPMYDKVHPNSLGVECFYKLILPDLASKKGALGSVQKRYSNAFRQMAPGDDKGKTLPPLQLSQLESNGFSSRETLQALPPPVLRSPIRFAPEISGEVREILVDRRLE